MKVEKFVKDRGNKYKVYIDGEEFKLYDDVIVKYSLGLVKDIDEDKLNEILTYNSEMSSYYLSIKYLTNKMKSEKEIRDYLHKHEISDSIIDKTIERLKGQGYLNENVYLKAFINDAINLSDKGPFKIRKELNKLGFYDEQIDEYLDKYDNTFWTNRVENIIDKKIKLNKNKSSYAIKNKILLDLQNLGYNKETISGVLSTIKINEKDAYLLEYEKAKKKLSKKYEGFELEQKIKMQLYRKGFKIGDYYEE